MKAAKEKADASAARRRLTSRLRPRRGGSSAAAEKKEACSANAKKKVTADDARKAPGRHAAIEGNDAAMELADQPGCRLRSAWPSR